MTQDMRIERFEGTLLRPEDRRFAAIEVPQGFCGVACGVKDYIGFVTTTVAQCVAVALVRKRKDKPPQVLLAHIDDFFSGADCARELLQRFQLYFKTSPETAEAYLLNGDSNPEFYEPILKVMWSRDMEIHANVECNQVFPLAIDLRTGDPLYESFRSSEFRLYKPNAAFEFQLEQFGMGNRPFEQVGYV